MSNQSKPPQKSPEAIMLLSSSCAFCPSVLDALGKMIKSGELSSLQVINLEQNPEAMQEYNVRSVPWVRIGTHELAGSQTLEAFQQRAQWAMDEEDQDGGDKTPISDFDFLLSDGQVNKVVTAIKKDETSIQAIMTLLGDSGTVLSTRIGIGVVFEEFSDSKLLKTLVPELGKLTQHEDSRIRADAFHYLGMTKDSGAIPFLEAGKNDRLNKNDEEIREIIADSLEELIDV